MFLLIVMQAVTSDSFGMKDLLTVILSVGGTLIITFFLRNWSSRDRDDDRIWKKIDDIERALLRVELDVRDLQGYVEPIKEAVRLTIAGMVPRPNPLSDQTNIAVLAWHEGKKLSPETLKAAAHELVVEAETDQKLTEAEKMMFSVTAAGMNYDATKMETQRIRIREGLL